LFFAFLSVFSYPPLDHVFSAFSATPLSKVRVVIIGQDPYFKQGQAHGLSFSVNKGFRSLIVRRAEQQALRFHRA
jgi:uracil DNA glycosylase